MCQRSIQSTPVAVPGSSPVKTLITWVERSQITPGKPGGYVCLSFDPVDATDADGL